MRHRACKFYMHGVSMCTSSCRSVPTPAVYAAFREVQPPPRSGAPMPILYPDAWWRFCRRCGLNSSSLLHTNQSEPEESALLQECKLRRKLHHR